MSPQTLNERLDSLYRFLSNEGWHVHANTVALAIEEINKRPRGRPPTGFDKKAYDRERMKRIRAEARAKTEEPK